MARARVVCICKLLPLVFVIYLVHLAVKQASFERFLRASAITFDDFPPAYAQELFTSTAASRPAKFDYNLAFPASERPESNIPPTIHFIFFENLYETHLDRTLIPSIGSKAPELCRDYNEDFSINTWNTTAARKLLELYYPWFISTYDAYRYPIQRVDAFKYFVLYHFGGIYMDLDIACRRSLRPLLDAPAWFPKARPLGVNYDLMASRPGHPVMRHMVDRLEGRNRWLVFPYLTIFWSTGPQFTSDILGEWWYSGGSVAKDLSDTVRVLPEEFYSEDYTFFGHSPGGTWHGDDVAFILWIVDRPWVLALIFAPMLGVFADWLRRRRNRQRTQIRTT